MTVQDLFNQVVLDLSAPPQCNFLDAIREVQGIIVARLLTRRAEMIKRSAPMELVFPSEVGSADLPDDYRALDGRPYLAAGASLAPLGQMAPSQLVTPGTPQYYSVAERSLRIYPPPSSETTLYAYYYFKPDPLTAMTDVLPFDGEFDQVFIAGCRALLTLGLSAVADPSFVAPVQSMVDEVVQGVAMADEQSLADELNGL